MRLHLYTCDLPLKNPFRTTHETRTIQPTLIVVLEEDGLRGYGEATATRYYGLGVDRMCAVLEELRAVIESTPWQRPEQFWSALFPHLREHPFELCALDVAAHDLHARRQGAPLYELWGLDPEDAPLSSYTIGIDQPEVMVEKLRATPWPCYKIKLGSGSDLELLRRLRQHTRAPFRIDINTGWSAEQTISYAPVLRALGVELIEQPLPPSQWDRMYEVRQRVDLPLFADESCQREEDVDQCAGYFDGVNIKLMKCGGFTPARRMINRARELGLQVMVGCMTESSIGISAIAQLAPLLDYVDMDGALLLADDPAQGVCLDQGKIYYPETPGTGAALKYIPLGEE